VSALFTREPSAEIPSACFSQKSREGSLDAISVQPSARPQGLKPHIRRCALKLRTFKEPEANTSQLNRLDGPTFLFAYFPISAVLLGVAFIFRFDHKSIGAKLLLNFYFLLRF